MQFPPIQVKIEYQEQYKSQKDFQESISQEFRVRQKLQKRSLTSIRNPKEIKLKYEKKRAQLFQQRQQREKQERSMYESLYEVIDFQKAEILDQVIAKIEADYQQKLEILERKTFWGEFKHKYYT